MNRNLGVYQKVRKWTKDSSGGLGLLSAQVGTQLGGSGTFLAIYLTSINFGTLRFPGDIVIDS